MPRNFIFAGAKLGTFAINHTCPLTLAPAKSLAGAPEGLGKQMMVAGLTLWLPGYHSYIEDQADPPIYLHS